MSTPEAEGRPDLAGHGATANTPDHIERLALRPAEAARALGVSERVVWELTNSGRVPVVRVGKRCVLLPIDGLREWLRDNAEGGGGAR